MLYTAMIREIHRDHGKCAVHSFNRRKLHVICDAIVGDPMFGVGALKVLSIYMTITFGKVIC